MKPGTLSTLNRNLCLRLQPDRVFVLRPVPPLLRAQVVAPHDTCLVVPALRLGTTRDAVPGRGIRSTFRKVMIRAGLLAVIGLVNLGLFGFERIERSRERYLLGRAIAERERHAQRLIEANRHIVGVVQVQNVLLQQRVTGPASVLARVTRTRRSSGAGI